MEQIPVHVADPAKKKPQKQIENFAGLHFTNNLMGL